MNQNDKIESFFSGLRATLDSVREVRKIYDPVMAFEFNSFNFWEPGENKISKILAFFLDPKQKHGQKDIFLQLFLKKFGLDEKVPKNAKVDITCEFPIEENRRIDIYITFNVNEYVIAIENKIWAKDQYKQLTDYNRHLKNKFSNYSLFYLNPYGLKPSEESISIDDLSKLDKEEKIKVISYDSQIIELIHEWSTRCQAERVRSFLMDFEQFLKQEITKEQIMSEHEFIIKHVLDNPKYIEIAFAVTNSSCEIKKRLSNVLNTQLKEIDNEKEFDIKLTHEFSDDRVDFTSKWSNHIIGVDSEGGKAFYGIKAIKENRVINLDLNKAIADKLGQKGNDPTPWWPWSNKLEIKRNLELNWNNAEPWVGILDDDKTKKVILDKVKELYTKLKDVDL